MPCSLCFINTGKLLKVGKSSIVASIPLMLDSVIYNMLFNVSLCVLKMETGEYAYFYENSLDSYLSMSLFRYWWRLFMTSQFQELCVFAKWLPGLPGLRWSDAEIMKQSKHPKSELVIWLNFFFHGKNISDHCFL